VNTVVTIDFDLDGEEARGLQNGADEGSAMICNRTEGKKFGEHKGSIIDSCTALI
jgi:hypothetical protein